MKTALHRAQLGMKHLNFGVATVLLNSSTRRIWDEALKGSAPLGEEGQVGSPMTLTYLVLLMGRNGTYGIRGSCKAGSRLNPAKRLLRVDIGSGTVHLPIRTGHWSPATFFINRRTRIQVVSYESTAVRRFY